MTAIRDGEMIFVKVAEMAAVLRISKMSVYRLINNGTLEANRCGRQFRNPVESARRYIGRSED
jgi:excisionase family DNA binding protein